MLTGSSRGGIPDSAARRDEASRTASAASWITFMEPATWSRISHHMSPAPTLYRLENIPSALSKDQVATLLEVTRRDRRPEGLRDAPAHQDLWAANTVSCAGTRIASTGF